MTAEFPGSEARGSASILIVEDDDAVARGVALNLRLAGFTTDVVHDGVAALDRARDRAPDLMLLDISLPRKNGLDVLRELRQRGDALPVIVLSARQDEFDKVAALRLGADDYVTKPFGVSELLARVDAVLRRSQAARSLRGPVAHDGMQFADVAIDVRTRTVTRGGVDVALTHLEFELLVFLVANGARVFSREDLLRHVWDRAASPRTVDNFVAQLRAKLEVDPNHPRHFITVRGSGYRFDP